MNLPACSYKQKKKRTHTPRRRCAKCPPALFQDQLFEFKLSVSFSFKRTQQPSSVAAEVLLMCWQSAICCDRVSHLLGRKPKVGCRAVLIWSWLCGQEVEGYSGYTHVFILQDTIHFNVETLLVSSYNKTCLSVSFFCGIDLSQDLMKRKTVCGQKGP